MYKSKFLDSESRKSVETALASSSTKDSSSLKSRIKQIEDNQDLLAAWSFREKVVRAGIGFDSLSRLKSQANTPLLKKIFNAGCDIASAESASDENAKKINQLRF